MFWKKFLALFLTLVCVTSPLWSDYKVPRRIPKAEWKEVAPRLLPEDHPIKKRLDRILAKSRVMRNQITFIQSGFDFYKPRTKSNAIVAKHRKLKGYVIKAFLEDQPVESEWHNWLDRAKGAELAAEVIEKKGYHGHLKAPKKWIYMLPNPKDRLCILVCEDMDVLKHHKNEKAWKRDMTKAKLDALYDVLETAGLFDSVYIDNTPFCKDGKLAFVDTEHHSKWPVRYDKLDGRLSGGMSKYWQSITR